MPIEFISASAGTGKTYTVVEHITKRLNAKKFLPSQLLATTFTNKAAGELKERILNKLPTENLKSEISKASIGTMHSLCQDLLKQNIYHTDLPPSYTVMTDEQCSYLLDEAMASVDLDFDEILALEKKFGFKQSQGFGATKVFGDYVKEALDAINTNNLNEDALAFSFKKSKELIDEIYCQSIGLDDFNMLLSELKEEAAQMPNRYGREAGLNFKQGKIYPGLAKLAHKDMSAKNILTKEKALKLVASKVLGSDIKQYLDCIQKAVKDSLEIYESLKAQNAILTYSDMESKTLKLLKDESNGVLKELHKTYKYIVIDEFQDTSPIQLEIFQLISNAEDVDVLWVGDPKQSIYGFRGADLGNVLEAVKDIKKGKPLANSYRTHQALVDVSNNLFGAIDEWNTRTGINWENITSKRKEDKFQSAHYSSWTHIDAIPSKKEDYVAAVAQEISEIIKCDDIKIPIKDSGFRKVKAGDICILAHTNDQLYELSDALQSIGIKTILNTKDITTTLEYRLLKAAILYLHRAHNSIHLFQLIRLMNEDGAFVKSLMKAYSFDYNTVDGKKKYSANQADIDSIVKDLPVDQQTFLACLLAEKKIAEESIVVQLRYVLHAVNTSFWVAKLGESGKRFSNLDKVVELANNYLSLSKVSGKSVDNFFHWFEALKGDDMRGKVVLADNAVNILTHSSSKGLEWPIVYIAFSQKDNSFKLAKTGGANVVRDSQIGRFLWFHIKPFGGARTDYPENLSEKFENHSFVDDLKKESKSEEYRKLYVSCTRAREILITDNPVNGKGGTQDKTLVSNLPHAFENPAEFARKNSLDFSMKKAGENRFSLVSLEAEYPIRDKWFTGYKEQAKKTAKPLFISPSKFREESAPDFEIKILASYADAPKIDYALLNRLIDDSEKAITNLGNLYHHACDLYFKGIAITESLYQSYGLEEAVFPLKELKANMEALKRYLIDNNGFTQDAMKTEVPIRWKRANQWLTGIADMVVETDQHTWVVDHKSLSEEDPAKLKSVISEKGYHQQLSLYQEVFEELNNKPVIKYLNLYRTGKLILVTSLNK